jgi:hypothetical protein
MKGAQAAANTSRLVPRACPWRVQGRALAFLPSLGSPVPKTDMRSKPNLDHQAAFCKRSFTQRDKLNVPAVPALRYTALSRMLFDPVPLKLRHKCQHPEEHPGYAILCDRLATHVRHDQVHLAGLQPLCRREGIGRIAESPVPAWRQPTRPL